LFFAWDINIPRLTAEASPVIKTLEIGVGVITHVGVKFPAGCHGLAKVRILHREFQLVPLSRGEWITGDDEAVPTESYYEILQAPALLKLVAVNDDDTYPHKLTVRISVLPKAVVSLMPFLTFIEKLTRRIFGE